MRGTSGEVFTVQGDRRDLLALDFPDPLKCKTCGVRLTLTDHPPDEPGRKDARPFSSQKTQTTLPAAGRAHPVPSHPACDGHGTRPDPAQRSVPQPRAPGAASPSASPQALCGLRGRASPASVKPARGALPPPGTTRVPPGEGSRQSGTHRCPAPPPRVPPAASPCRGRRPARRSPP